MALLHANALAQALFPAAHGSCLGYGSDLHLLRCSQGTVAFAECPRHHDQSHGSNIAWQLLISVKANVNGHAFSKAARQPQSNTHTKQKVCSITRGGLCEIEAAWVQGAARTPTSAQRQLRKPPDTEPAWGTRARRTTGVSATGQSSSSMSLSLCTDTLDRSPYK